MRAAASRRKVRHSPKARYPPPSRKLFLIRPALLGTASKVSLSLFYPHEYCSAPNMNLELGPSRRLGARYGLPLVEKSVDAIGGLHINRATGPLPYSKPTSHSSAGVSDACSWTRQILADRDHPSALFVPSSAPLLFNLYILASSLIAIILPAILRAPRPASSIVESLLGHSRDKSLRAYSGNQP
jgi:hypothetical protein